MNIDQFAGCQFHYAAFTGDFAITKEGQDVTPPGIDKQEAFAAFLRAKHDGRMSQVDELSGVRTYVLSS